MKKIMVVFALVFLFVACFLFLKYVFPGSFEYHYIDVESGSQWTCQIPQISLNFVTDGKAEGTITLDEETIDIECLFGPGKKDFIVYEIGDTNGDNYLFRGEYIYNKKKETITFNIDRDQVELSEKQIVLHKE